jgi:hypothetical protein
VTANGLEVILVCMWESGAYNYPDWYNLRVT